MRETIFLDPDQIRFRNFHPHILIETASEWYGGRIGHIKSVGVSVSLSLSSLFIEGTDIGFC